MRPVEVFLDYHLPPALDIQDSQSPAPINPSTCFIYLGKTDNTGTRLALGNLKGIPGPINPLFAYLIFGWKHSLFKHYVHSFSFLPSSKN